MEDSRRQSGCLEISCHMIEFNVKPGEVMEDSFTIHAENQYAQGKLYSSDTRIRLYETEFKGEDTEIGYCFDATTAEAGSNIKGEIVIISNCGEYTIPYHIEVQ